MAPQNFDPTDQKLNRHHEKSEGMGALARSVLEGVATAHGVFVLVSRIGSK
jgi:hypothetical protein